MRRTCAAKSFMSLSIILFRALVVGRHSASLGTPQPNACLICQIEEGHHCGDAAVNSHSKAMNCQALLCKGCDAE